MKTKIVVLSYPTQAEAAKHQQLYPGSEYFWTYYGLWFLRVVKEVRDGR